MDARKQHGQIREVFGQLQKQIPMLYAAALVSIIGMHIISGAAGLTVAPVSILLLIIVIWRACFWTFLQKPSDDPEVIRRELLDVVAFTIVLSGGVSIWVHSLITDLPNQSHTLLFFSVLGALGGAFGLCSFSRAALIPLLLLGIPVALRSVAMGDSLMKALGGSLLLVQIIFLRLLQGHGAALRSLIHDRTVALLEHDRAMSAEAAAVSRSEADELTGLANRAKLIRDITRYLTEESDSSRRGVVAVCDLDGFKRANDVFGHAAGDALLKAFGKRLTEEFGDVATVARVGGDEFAIFWRHGLAPDGLAVAADRICAIASQPVDWNGKKLTVCTSCGLAEQGAHSPSVDELLRQADTALYMAKASGRGQWKVYDEEAFAIDKRRAQLEVLLLNEEATNELYVDFQPILDVTCDRIVFVEALARWNNHQLGAIGPSEFIFMAETLGTIETVGEAIFDKALEKARSWNADVRLSLNLSGAQISREGAAERIIATLSRQGVTPDRLLFEINDGTVLTDLGVTKRELERLRDAGALVALDDFGVGHASVAYLRDLAFDVVKIDGSLTRDIQYCARSRQILLGLINLCHAAGALCVAEHIETDEQLGLVQAMGCDLVQGFFVSRPLAADQLEMLQPMPVTHIGRVTEM